MKRMNLYTFRPGSLDSRKEEYSASDIPWLTRLFPCGRRLVIVLLLTVLPFIVQSQIPDFVWAKSVGGTGADFSRSIAVDNNGDIYICGFYNTAADFNPGGTGGAVTSAGTYDMFLAKYSPSGVFYWVKTMGGTGSDQASRVAVGDNGDVYLTGIIASPGVDFNPGGTGGTVSVSGSMDAFVAKFNTNGVFQWAKALGGTGIDRGQSVAVNANGDVFVCGEVASAGGNFNPGGTGGSVTSAGGSDAFLAKYSSNGTFQWVKTIAGTASDLAFDVTVDINQDVYVTGNTASATTNFNVGGTGGLADGNGADDVYVAKYTTAGTFLWVKRVGGNLTDQGRSVRTDANGNLYISGNFQSTANFNSGGTGGIVTSAGNIDIYLAKYNSTGAFQWVRSMGGTAPDYGLSIGIDTTGDVYLAGEFQGNTDLNPGGPGGTLNTGGGSEGYLAKYSGTGVFQGARHFTGPESDFCHQIAVDYNNNVYAIGQFSASGVNVNVGGTGGSLSSVGGSDVFVVKFGTNCMVFDTLTETVCDSFVFNGQTYTSSGIYSDTLVSSLLCDSIVTLNLTISGQTIINPVVTEHYCDSAVINGNVYYTGGIYEQTFPSVTGCDSIMTFDITIGHTNNGPTLTETACNQYVVDNNTIITNSGTHALVFTNQSGCDSNVILQLTIIEGPDAAITMGEGMLLANNGDSYQWLDCDQNMTAIQWATGDSYQPEGAGNYAVIVSANGCSDTSDCFAYDPNNIHELAKGNQIHVFPNPVKDYVHISTQKRIQSCDLRLVNISGQVLWERRLPAGGSIQIDMSSFAAGLYFLELTDSNSSNRIKVNKL
jgi:hypothetical protein